VLYVNIDYFRDRVAPELKGPRLITEAEELAEPTRRWPEGDTVDYGLELSTECGRRFSVTWDRPGPMGEGIGLREAPLLATLSGDANIALWDATELSRWSEVIPDTLTEVDLHYLPWDSTSTGYWCPHITLRTETHHVELLLGDIDRDGELRPSADNVLVLFNPAELPKWAPTE
jgi:hypothetical protein